MCQTMKDEVMKLLKMLNFAHSTPHFICGEFIIYAYVSLDYLIFI